VEGKESRSAYQKGRRLASGRREENLRHGAYPRQESTRNSTVLKERRLHHPKEEDASRSVHRREKKEKGLRRSPPAEKSPDNADERGGGMEPEGHLVKSRAKRCAVQRRRKGAILRISIAGEKKRGGRAIMRTVTAGRGRESLGPKAGKKGCRRLRMISK